MATAKTEKNEKELEQKHLDNIMGQIKDREKTLKNLSNQLKAKQESLIHTFLTMLNWIMMVIPLQWKQHCQSTSSNNY